MEKANKPQEEKKTFKFNPSRSEVVKTYTVKSGDTLSAIAKKFYGDESDYMKIYEANKDLIGKDPNNIKVGQELQIPPK